MRCAIILSSLLIGAALPAYAQVTIAFGVPSQSIGMNMPTYPDFQRVPKYPVYYAPQANSNLFFYDGMYWAYQKDNWYRSSWYNGPWHKVSRKHVPNYILRVPVRYYRHPPQYFRGWSNDAPPRWGQYYGAEWEQERHGWDTWDRRSAPPPAPLPVYQRQYYGDRYPQYEQQPVIRSQYYQYQPSDPVVRQHYHEEEVQAKRYSQQHEQQQRAAAEVTAAAAPAATAKQQQEHTEQQPQGAAAHDAQAPASGQENAPQGKGGGKDSKPGKDKGDDADKANDNDKGQGHNG